MGITRRIRVYTRVISDQEHAQYLKDNPATPSSTPGRNGFRMLGITSRHDPEWERAIDALADYGTIHQADRAAAKRSEKIKNFRCPNPVCGSSSGYGWRQGYGNKREGLLLTCSHGCSTKVVLEAIGIPTDDIDEKYYRVEEVDAEDITGTASEQPAEPHRKVVLTPASAIKPQRVKWLWKQRLALGTLALLAGREGLGKTILAYTIAAMITRGALDGEFGGLPKSVLVAATEDSWEHTVVPRLIAAGADLDRVYRVEVIAGEIHSELTLPKDNEELRRQARAVDAALLILDPLMSRIDSRLDTHKDGEVRRALEPLVKVAGEANLAVWGIIHHNKSGSTDPLQIVMGSKAFTAVARSVHAVVPDPDDEKRRLYGTPKNNLGRDDLPSLGFHIETFEVPTDDGPTETGRLVWGLETTTTIGEAMRQSASSAEDKSETAACAEWLDEYLYKRGGSAPASEAQRAGHAAGYSTKVMRSAKDKLKVVSAKSDYQGGWYWSLAEDAHQDAHHRGDSK